MIPKFSNNAGDAYVPPPSAIASKQPFVTGAQGSGLAFVLVLMYISLVYLRPQEYVSALQGVPLMPIILAAALLVWLPQGGKSFVAGQHTILPVLLLYVAFSVAINGWLGGAVKALTDLLPSFVLFYLLVTTLTTLSRHRKFMAVMITCALIMAAHGINQSQTGIGWSSAQVVQGSRITYVGLFNDPNDLAVAFVVVLPMLAFMLSRARSNFERLIWIGATATVIYALYLTNSRGGMLAALAQYFVYAANRIGLFKAGVTAISVGASLLMLPSRLENLDSDEESAAGRVEAWYAGLQMLIANPFFGVGRDNFLDHHDLAAHNALVLAFAELGLVGYFIWLSFIVLSVIMVYKLANISPSDAGRPAYNEGDAWEDYRALARTYFCAMVGFCVACFFLSRTFNIQLFILCAMCAGFYQCAVGHWPSIAHVRFKDLFGRLLAFELASVAGIALLVRVLL